MKFYPFSSPSIDLPGVDLNTWFNPSPMSSYLVRAEGDSMTGAGIYSGSVLVVDRALEPLHGDIVIAELNGGFTVKRLELRPTIRLIAENKDYSGIPVTEGDNFEIFGVVTTALRNIR